MRLRYRTKVVAGIGVCCCWALLGHANSATAFFQEKKAQEKANPVQEKDRPKFNAADLNGDWVIKSGKRQGEDIPAERLPPAIKVDKENFTIPAGPDQEFVISFKVDATTSPVSVDFEIKSGPVEGGRAIGILKLDRNALTLCYDPVGENRPKEFASTAENGCFLFVMEKNTATFDAKKMEGTWTYSAGNKAGEELSEERLMGEVVISSKDFTVPAGPTEKFVMSYKLDAAKTPVAIDLKIESGPAPEANALGIIKLDGDSLSLCYDPSGNSRPEKFEANGENGFFLFTLKRKK